MTPSGAPIRRNDPWRQHLHDYFLVDASSGCDIGGFGTEQELASYFSKHVAQFRGKVTICQVVHPDGCGCREVA